MNVLSLLNPDTLNPFSSLIPVRYPAVFCRGFTLLEALIALAILVLVTAVLLPAHLHATRTEETARWIEASRLRAESVLTRSWLGIPLDQTPLTNDADWIVVAELIEAGPGQARAGWRRWIIAPSNHPAARTVWYQRRE